jgi:transcription antitermination factor NusG
MWIALIVFEDTEHLIEEELGAAGYLPKQSFWVKSRLRKRKPGEPSRRRKFIALFPGYVFCDMNLISDHDLFVVMKNRRVLGLLRNADTCMVDEKKLLAIQEAEKRGDYDETRKLFSSIVGTSHEIIAGPFIGKIAHVRDIVNGKIEADISTPGVRGAFPVKIPLSKFDEIRHTDEPDDREHERG